MVVVPMRVRLVVAIWVAMILHERIGRDVQKPWFDLKLKGAGKRGKFMEDWQGQQELLLKQIQI